MPTKPFDSALKDVVEDHPVDWAVLLGLRAATSVLMGLRHPAGLIQQLLKGLWPMWENVLEDSSVIREFVNRAKDSGIKIGEDRGIKIGEDRGIKIGQENATIKFRDALLRLGERRLGAPDALSRAKIEAITDIDRLASLYDQILQATSWHELLG
jgi:hypothetical protein